MRLEWVNLRRYWTVWMVWTWRVWLCDYNPGRRRSHHKRNEREEKK